MRHIRAHWRYITRNGRLPAEDQRSDRLAGHEELNPLENEWRYGGFAITEQSDLREAFNIVLPMPSGTDPEAVRLAAAEFAAEEFGGHQYVVVLHTLDSDPNAHPSPNPHVHLCVKSRGEDGVRVNPRKRDLQRWREGFAERLRERGVDAAASSRADRFQRVRGVRQQELHARRRGVRLLRSGGKNSPQDARLNEVALANMARLGQAARILVAADDANDRRLALELTEWRSRARERDIQRMIGR